MDRQALVVETADFLERGVLIKDIKPYLQQSGVAVIDIDALIVEAGLLLNARRDAINKKKYNAIFKRSKWQAWLWLALFVVCFYVFFIYLPHKEITGYIFIISLTGACALCLFGILTYLDFRSMDMEYVQKNSDKRTFYMLMPLVSILPVFLMYYFISANINLKQQDLLDVNQQSVVGTVIGGRAVRATRLLGGDTTTTDASLAISYTTKQGDTIIATKAIPESDFKNYYKGQQINIVYSKDNPHHFEMVVKDEEIRRYKHTEEREVDAKDLLRMVDMDSTQLRRELIKISSGWVYNKQEQTWANDKLGSAIKMKNNKLFFVGNRADNYYFPEQLLQNGFVRVNKDEPDEILEGNAKIFDNGKLIITVAANENNALVNITRK